MLYQAAHRKLFVNAVIDARVAEWQTRRIQNPLSERACGFDSHPGHQADVNRIRPRQITVNEDLYATTTDSFEIERWRAVRRFA